MKIHYNDEFKAFETTECDKTDTIELDGVPLMITSPETKLENDENVIYYIIEEYQGRWDRWVPLRDGWGYYLKAYEYGQMTACGDCWQQTGRNGTFDKQYAMKMLSDLTAMLMGQMDDEIYNPNNFKKMIEVPQISGFRLCEIHAVTRKHVLSSCIVSVGSFDKQQTGGNVDEQ